MRKLNIKPQLRIELRTFTFSSFWEKLDQNFSYYQGLATFNVNALPTEPLGHIRLKI